MPCKDAMVTKVVTVGPDQSVEEVMDILSKNNIRHVPVVDKNKALVGMFGAHLLLKNLLPVSVAMEDGLQHLDFVIGAAPGMAMRLRKLMPVRVEQVMERNVVVVQPETPTWEALRLLYKYATPLPVVNEQDGRMLGLISEQSAIAELIRTAKDMETGKTAVDM